MKTDVVIIGAGASGLMCAIEAGKRGRSVLVLDHCEKAASKILVSGGGRCNFSNRIMGRENYISQNPRFATSALSRFTPSHFLSIVESHGIRYHEREEGQLFCNEKSSEIADMLRSECDRAAVRLQLNCKISEISKTEGFRVATDKGICDSESLVIATGGLSYPNLGASNFGYTVAKQFGLKVTKLNPALTPLRFSPEDAEIYGGLAGISIDSTVSHGGAKFRGNLLFTHNGISGPVILQISSYWDRESSLTVDLLPALDIFDVFLEKRHSKTLLATILDQYLPKRFVRLWCDLYSVSRPINQYSQHELDSIARSLHGWPLRADRTEGFNKAEVTLGGVDTDELSSRSMESRKLPGLYFLGEVIDVTGHLGGYNLHWAWASGYAGGQFV
ncbi:MAG: NAD(P)/FAD-dependent oxidoreductase [Syntrophobacteraceae bacterium]